MQMTRNAVWRWVGWTVLALVLLMAGAVIWFASSFDGERYKRLAIDWMKTEHNRTLQIAGPLKLSIFPRLGVQVAGVRLSEPGRAETFVSVERAAVSAALWPLLRGDVVIGGVDARGVRVTLQRDKNGVRNIDDFLRPAPAADAAAAPAAEESAPMRLDIRRIELADVRARVQDEMTDLDGELVIASLSTGRIADKVETPVSVAAHFDFKTPAIQGDLTGDADVTPELTTGSAAVSDMTLAFKGDVPGASAVDALLEGSVVWNGNTRAVEAQPLRVKLAATAGALTLETSTASVERFAYAPAAKSLSMTKLQAKLTGTQAGEPVSLELDWPELNATRQALGGSGASGRFSRGGALPIELRFKTGAPTGSFDAISFAGVQAELTSRGKDRQLSGTLRSRLTVRPAPVSVALDGLDLNAKLEGGGLPALTVAASGEASASAERAQWKLNGRLNDGAFDSDGLAKLDVTPLHVRANARFDALDLDRLLGPGSAASAPAGGTASGSGGDTPVDLSGLRSLDGEFALRAGSFNYKQYRVRDARLDATLEAGMLRVTSLQGMAWGGQFDARAIADARASRVAVDGVARGIDVKALLADVAGKDWIEGTGNVTVDLEAAGRTVQEMQSRLAGRAALDVKDGAIRGINLAKRLREAKAMLTSRRDESHAAVQTEKTDFSELHVSFNVAEGVARSNDLDVKSPFLRISGAGTIDIGRGRVDYLVRTTVTDTAKGQGGDELAALRGVTVPVRLSGPFDALDWKIEWSAVATGAIANKLRDRLGDKLGIGAPDAAASAPAKPATPKEAAREALKDKLRNIFK